MCDHCGCRAIPAIAALTAEHETILALAWTLAEATRHGDPTDPAVLDQLVRLLDAHVVQEETGLYPLLMGTDDLSITECDALEDEHREIETWLTAGSLDRRGYYSLAAHIEAEETYLFPAAMFGFDDEEWETLEAIQRLVAPGGGPLDLST